MEKTDSRKRELEDEEAAEVETLGRGWKESQGPAGCLSSAGEKAVLKQRPVPWQAQDVGLVAGILLRRATPVSLPGHILFQGIQWSVEKKMLVQEMVCGS